MLSNSETRASTPDLMEVAPGLHGLRNVFVNLYYAAATTPGLSEGLPTAGAPWVLIDAGLPGAAAKIIKHAEELFGPNNPPQAILLTHGHFDHAGGLHGVLEAYPGVPVYAHPLELPYLTGLSAYPPPDPTVGGGMMAYLSFSYPKQPYDFGNRVQALPADGSVPSLPGWRWIHTPGHTFGHVSFFREGDKVLVAGDAFTTVKGESGWATFTQSQIVHGPPAYFTPDWDAARDSVRKLGALRPEIAATGHGIAMHGEELREQLADLSVDFDTIARPKKGRYASIPATADASGVRSIPPPRVSPVVKSLAVAGALGTVIALIASSGSKKKKKGGRDYTGVSRPTPQSGKKFGKKSGPSSPRTEVRPLATPIARQDNHADYEEEASYGYQSPDSQQRYAAGQRRGPDMEPRRTVEDTQRNQGAPGKPVLLGPIGGGNGEPLVFAHHQIRYD
jgi:glyoxylase-like metal-dependent hydrolase (beta-lactamase superfamily II)